MSGLEQITDKHNRLLTWIALLPMAAGLSLLGQSFTEELRLAESGEAKAMTALAHRYEQGIGCPRDAGQAILWYQRAVNRKEPGAMVALGDIYDEGKCVDQNMGEALRLYRRAIEVGSPEAMFRLGRMVEYGRGVRADRDEARSWYEKAAANGVAPAMLALGDLTRDAAWYRKAADAGEVRAFAKLAATLPEGEEASRLYRRGADAGDPAAMFAIAREAERRKSPDALELYRHAAEAGSGAAMSRYAELLKRDRPGESQMWYTKAAEIGDPAGLTWLAQRTEAKSGETAHAIYERAVAAGYLPAMTRLGVLRADCPMMRRAGELGDADGMFEYASRCTPPDARAWLEKAAALNHAEALAQIGETKRAAEAGHRASMNVLARTDPEWRRRAAEAGEAEPMRLYAATLSDPGDAARWYKRAAEAGDVPAMAEIGRRFETGTGVAADRETAISWYRQAAEKGSPLAMYRLGVLSSDTAWLRKASDAEVPEAMCLIAESTDDREQKLALFRRAADAGYVNAWTRIGVLTGDAAMFERASQAGDAEATLRLGEIEYQRKKRREAFKLFRAAADAGYSPAMIRVGDCHLNGDGAYVSEVDAVNWYRKAALAGNQEALDKLRQLGKTQ